MDERVTIDEGALEQFFDAPEHERTRLFLAKIL